MAPPAWSLVAADGFRADAWHEPRGVRFLAQPEGACGVDLRLDLGPAPRASLSILGVPRTAGWTLEAGLPPADCPDVFREARDWVAARLGRRDRGALDAGLGALAAHAAGLCLPAPREAARPFPSHLRWAVYAWLAADASGRLTQVARTCPGAVLLLQALREHGKRGERVAPRLEADLIRGRRLDASLDDALASWLGDGRRRAARQLPLFEPLEPVLAGEARLLQLRLLVRRAGPLAPAGPLLRLPEAVPVPEDIPAEPVAPAGPLLRLPEAVPVPEDIPAEPVANATWFRRVEAAQNACRLAPPAFRAAFVAFASRHAVDLDAAEQARGEAGLLEELCDYLRACGRTPSRDASPARLAEESARWHAQLARAQALESVRRHYGSLADQRFPEPPVAAFRGPDLEIAPITNAIDLAREGEELRHCVASRLPDVLAGTSAVYAAVVKGRRLTVEVMPSPGRRHSFGDVRGFANALPTPDERQILRRWLEGQPVASAPEARRPDADVYDPQRPWTKFLVPRPPANPAAGPPR